MKDVEEIKSLLKELIAITFTEAFHREMDYQRQRDHAEPDELDVARQIVRDQHSLVELYEQTKQDLLRAGVL